MIELLAISAALLFGAMTIGFSVSIIISNMGVVDVLWGGGLAVAASILGWLYADSWVQWVPVCLIVLWGIRLAGFLLVTRVWIGEKDHRYEALLEKWGTKCLVKSLGNFYLQSSLQLLLIVVLFPVFLSPAPITQLAPLHYAALALFMIAMVGETLADWQLHQFKKSNSGICKGGLWSISRHPNYFFEVLIWIAIAVWSVGLPNAVVAWISPITIWIIVRHVTGPYTERLSLKKRPEAYAAYQDAVPMIIPNPFKRSLK